MNRTFFAILLVLTLLLTGCEKTVQGPAGNAGSVVITLGEAQILVDGKTASTDPTAAVYTANDLVYYEEGKDFTYGEGTQADAHSAAEAAAHTVVHIAKAGTYRLCGTLPKGQIAVDLGEGAEDDPSAMVTLILDGVDITCEAAPAVIFYRVYECGNTDSPSKDVDTSAAGANVIIADGSRNTVNGSYVARIYKPDTVILNAEGTAVDDAKKLHKYDGAFYSKMSMNIDGGEEGSGTLAIYAKNEGLDSELHLTINGGNISIFSGNDGINTNEDGVSVTTINGGTLNISVTGETGEGDGIDSNGWLVINGGSVIASACANSADAGIDSDMGIHINSGTVIAGGHMLDRIEDGGQTYAVFSFAQEQNGKETLLLKDKDGAVVQELTLPNACSTVIYSSSKLQPGTYTLWRGQQQLAGAKGVAIGGGMQPGGIMPDGQGGNIQPPQGELPANGIQSPDDAFRPGEKMPPDGGLMPPDGNAPPDRPQAPGGGFGKDFGGNRFDGESFGGTQTLSAEFVIAEGGNMFSGIAPMV
ncbi:MAG: carbohydrate-binding domain-containing protein [Oscillospiraceae bacterium]|nr:carbohydrate-binding domain-containing protein [Oscillospiraceae bacterium]